jgi:flagellar P-ring protein precursor FlgI
MSEMRMTLRNPDFTTSRRIAEAINIRFPGAAVADNPTIVTLRPPAGLNMMSFVSQVENLTVDPDSAARVVIDEVAGVIVMGENVRVSTVAIAQGSLTITVSEQPAVSQPNPMSRGGQNALGVTPRDMISILQTIRAAGALQADIEVM